MNYYFLLEDEKSFLKVLPSWLEHMGFGYERVADIQGVKENTYVLQSGQGVTQLITKVLFDTIDTILMNPGKIDKLVIILDAEELEIEQRKKEVNEQIKNHYQGRQLDFEIVIWVVRDYIQRHQLKKIHIFIHIIIIIILKCVIRKK